MAADLKKIITKVVKTIQSDDSLLKNLKKDPAKVIKKLITETLTDSQFDTVVEGVMKKLAGDKAEDLIKGFLKK